MRYLLCLACLLALAATPARADPALFQGLVREPTMLPVSVGGGREARLETLIVRPDRPGRFPLVVIVHGTPRGTGGEFSATLSRMSPAGYLGPATMLATRGYAVASIMRRGFGHSDGPYAERYSGPCDNRDYLSVAQVSAQDVLGAVAALRREPWADPDRVVLLGHSTGGLAVSAAAAANPPGVVGILDFAGGRGSDAPNHVCSEGRLVEAFGALGRTARIPALWLYSENDHFFPPALAQRMFAAYTAAGAPARLAMLPPVGTDGHMALRMAPPGIIWPPVEAFLASLRLPTQIVVDLPPLPVLAPPPGLNPGCADGFRDYAAARIEAKAFAVAPQGHCGWQIGAASPAAAEETAMASCAKHAAGCTIYAVGQSPAAR